MTGSVDLDAYLARVGYAGDTAPRADTLAALVFAHVTAITFENLDTLAGRPVRLGLEALQDKLVLSRRGGYCFEHNKLFAAVLRALGFKVNVLAARVGWGRPKDAPPPPRTHVLLHVDLDEGAFIADAGFGGMTPTAPLRLEADTEQETPHEPFRLSRTDDGYRLATLIGGDWIDLYRFDLQTQTDADLEMMNHFTATHPDSVFVGALSAARIAPGKRLALRNARLSVHHADGRTEREQLQTATDIRQALADVFALDVPDDPRLDEAFARFAREPAA